MNYAVHGRLLRCRVRRRLPNGFSGGNDLRFEIEAGRLLELAWVWREATTLTAKDVVSRAVGVGEFLGAGGAGLCTAYTTNDEPGHIIVRAVAKDGAGHKWFGQTAVASGLPPYCLCLLFVVSDNS